MKDPRIPKILATLKGAGVVRMVRAPGRVNLIGDHTDYCEGFVLPMAIDRDCVVAAARRGDGRVRARSLDVDGCAEIPADASADPRTVEPAWGRFVAGAVCALAERGAHFAGIDLVVSSTVPTGSGLSSSSALSVALTLALADAGGLVLDRIETAVAALDAEVRATGVPGGLMDQLTALFGVRDRALLIDCRDLHLEPLPLPESLSVVVAHSGVARSLATSAYAERRASCEAAAERLRLHSLRDASLDQVVDDPRPRHVVTENARVLAFADALRAGDDAALGPLMLASHASLRDDFEVSTPELDLLVAALVEAGALGARLTGAGFGGCVVGLVERTRASRVLGDAVRRYREATGLDPFAFVARSVDGGGRLDLGEAGG